MSLRLARRTPVEVVGSPPLVIEPETLDRARSIVEEVRHEGEVAVRRYGERFGDLCREDPLLLEGDDLQRVLEEAEPGTRALLERVAARIRDFAQAQRSSLVELDRPLVGGRAGHRVRPVASAGCYAPGGRFPLPSSVLMTAVTARVAGVRQVWVASPRPSPVTLCAAAVAGADGVLCVGGAQGIAALAYGAGVPACDMVVGPGNRYVTAAKQLVSGSVGIDMLAGPSELLVVAGTGADPATVAADLLAQAEHDPDARPLLVVMDEASLESVEAELEGQLADLPTATSARAALANGFVVVCGDLAEAVAVSDALAPEHLELHGPEVEARAKEFSAFGGLFVGRGAAEVLGDYGAGPNHVLPTAGGGRFRGGLSVLDFLRVQTWMRIDDEGAAVELYRDARDLARLEGLEGHARAASRRIPGDPSPADSLRCPRPDPL